MNFYTYEQAWKVAVYLCKERLGCYKKCETEHIFWINFRYTKKELFCIPPKKVYPRMQQKLVNIISSEFTNNLQTDIPIN